MYKTTSIEVLQTLLKSQSGKNHLAFISAYFRALLTSLDILESRNARAKKQCDTVVSVHEASQAIPHLQSGFDAVIARNSGLKTLLPVLRTLYPDFPLLGISQETEYLGRLPPAARARLESAPLTSVDVERSCSRYKAILRSNRESFTPENLLRR